MSEVEALFQESMKQTTDCQEMVEKLLNICNKLIHKVEELQIENNDLKEEIKNEISKREGEKRYDV